MFLTFSKEERAKLDKIRDTPMGVANLEEIIDDKHAIISSSSGSEYYVPIMSFVDKDLLEPGCTLLTHHQSKAVIGVLPESDDPLVHTMKVEKAPLETYAEIGGLDQQINEVKEAVELPLTHPELYEEIGIKPPKGNSKSPLRTLFFFHHFYSSRGYSLWSTWNWKDLTRKSCC